MHSPTAHALLVFVAWTLGLVLLMVSLRSLMVLRGERKANQFTPDNADLSPFMQRLARAHVNCLEGLAAFGSLMLLALATQRTALTDPLACWLIGARLVQTGVHLISTSPMAVSLRFTAFLVQVGIALYWVWQLLH